MTSKSASLGTCSDGEAGSKVELIREQPAIGLTLENPAEHRQFLVDRFPYKVVYRERVDDVYIVAIAHSSRRPGYWRNRR